MTLRQKITAGVVAIAILGVAGWCIRRDSFNAGRVDQRLETSATAVKHLTIEKVVVDKAADVEVKKSIAKRPEYRAARAKIEIQGDSVFADGQRLELPSLADFVKVADARAGQDSTTIVKQAEARSKGDILVGALTSHVDLLQEVKKPRCSRKCGVVIGVAGTAVVVIIAVKIIQAVGHR